MKPIVYFDTWSKKFGPDGPEGNAFFIIGKVQKALKSDPERLQAFTEEATSGDYEHLLETVEKYCTIELNS